MKRRLLVLCGVLMVVVASIGIFVPLLPTTPFLLIAATCFLKSSNRMYQWLLSNRIYGKYIKNYIEKKGVPVRIKILTLILLWAGISFSFFIATDNVWIRVALVLVLLGVSTHILLIRNKNS